MTTATSSSTQVCPKCKGLCRTVVDIDGDYDKCVNCGWTSDSQFTPAEEPASKEAADCVGPECELPIVYLSDSLCSGHYQQKRRGGSLMPLRSHAKPKNGPRELDITMKEAPLPEPQVGEEEALAAPGLTVEELLDRLRAHIQDLNDELDEVNSAIVVIEWAIKEANA